MITDDHREVLKEAFGSGPIMKVHNYLVENNITHPKTGRVPSYSTVRWVYNGIRPDRSVVEDTFIEEKIFEYAEIYKLERIKESIKQSKENDAKAKRLKHLK